MVLINCGTYLDITWVANCNICKADREIIFWITNTKSFFLVTTLSIQDNTKLLQYNED